MPKYAIFSSCFSPGSFFGIRERRPFAPTIGLLTLRVDKGQNLRRARHRARKGIGSTSNHLLKCPWRASNPPLRNLVQQRNPPLPAIESFYKGCELRRIRIAMAEWTKEVHSALREFRCRKQYHGGAAYLNKTPTRPRLQHRRARPPSPW